ncbi:Kinase [Hexamita inflata]|uniref:non-specific serine/threonine protein kinase n=1 Tax=Hexamita inflata TaxID=28002 RepID=A0AA86P717_9EUKA|nr:Kinase [Hexamita inflata]
MSINFNVVKTLGQGSFGTVKLVSRKEDGRKYAMKEINVAKMDQRDRADQLNEIRILASIFHPNVLAYYEAFIESGKLFIITEFAELGDLDGEIQARLRSSKPFSEEDVWSVFLQSMSGLRQLHDQGILHRDIKGQNILRFQNLKNPQKPIYKLADFGVSKVIKDVETDFAKTQIGTPFYLCPEIWQNKEYNAAADIFSMGVLLYELMALKHPYNGRDMKELNRNVLKGQYAPLPAKYSKELRELCYSMLSNNPDKRPSVKEIFIQPFVEDHFKDSPIPVTEVNIGQETALEANVDWEDPEMMSTIQMNPKLLAAMAGRLGAGQNPYQRPQYGYNPYKAPVPQSNSNVSDVQKALPEPEYEKRKQFELLQKVHDDRAKRSQQVDNGSQERARSENANPFAKENISQPQVKPQSYVQTPTRPQVIVQKQAVQEHKPFAPIMKPPTPVKNPVTPVKVAPQQFNKPSPYEKVPNYKPSSAVPVQKQQDPFRQQAAPQVPGLPKKPAVQEQQSVARKAMLDQNKGSRFW